LDHFDFILAILTTAMGIIEKAAIFGAAGATGREVGAELNRRGIPFRAVGRNRGKLEAAFRGMPHAEIFDADLADLRSASAAARGVDTIVYCVGLPLPSHHLFPGMMRTALQAAAAMQVRRMALVSSPWSYGVPRTARVAETHPRLPEARKAQYRKEQEDLLLDAQKRGQIDGLVIRLPIFYGPGVEVTVAHQIFKAALDGKTANWLGPVNTQQEFVFVPDTGPAIVELASSSDAYGEAWNFGGPGPINTLDFITRVYRAAGRSPKYRTAGRGMLKIMGWFNPMLRELAELFYLFETPMILDDSKLLARFPGIVKTPYDEGIRRTVEWMRAR
jgi:nucleoside-diphosphate-sugar epimerase